MTFEWWFAYLLTSIILSLSPGSGAINTMTTSINHGYRGAAASIAGLQTGLGIHIALVGIGLGTLFSRSVLAFEVLKWAGAAYLIWLGIQQWRAAGAINLNTLAQTQNRGHLFKRAVLGRVRISTLRNENETFSQLNSITYIGVFLRLVTYSHLP